MIRWTSARIPLRAGAAAAVSGGLATGLLLEQSLRGVDAERRDAYVRSWARGMLRALHVDVMVDGRRAHPPPGPHLVVANHRSTVDIFVMLDLFGGHMLARGDMAGWPIAGALAKLAGTLFVDRSDSGSRAKAVRQITDHLRNERTITVFPEGTTHTDDVVRPFHAGAFLAIARAHGFVTPVGLAYEDPSAHFGDESVGEHFRRVLEAPRTRVSVAIGDPIATEGVQTNALRDRAHAAVQSLVNQARARL
ncbi:MAG: 1-acyl-sn-glycerol-3-phosphate acyltransferase [Deltaproteobacteria bacterium]|nr:1-acyl-sn-glycerol-3-phosphate acyltransferase [Deltaproteobacteria bacterium]